MLVLAIVAAASSAATVRPAAAASPTAPRDGQRDFDWEWGRWTTKVRVLQNPLSGEAPKWAEFAGTSVIKPLLDGKANFVELSVAGSAGRIEGGSLRLYNPRSRQWSLNFASLRNGMLTAPVYGRFDEKGAGTFVGQDVLDGKAILVRFVITRASPGSARFEQAYSADGGATWETNWVATDMIERP
ncbi:hypothetical protein ACQKIE_15295 [Luteibacter sp. NPDC031894]|jgi:hypothetical protein|uniref:hypothetical protein n=1 Tax=Luteibacter sp. NPDC031894 TaxID=3390572 RepID=UPI003D03221F